MDQKGAVRKQKGAASKDTGASSSKARESLRDFKKRMRESKKFDMDRADYLQDEYEKSMKCGSSVKSQTGLTYSDEMMKHKCEWDHGYPENPNRYIAIMQRLQELGLIERCKFIEIKEFETKEILKVHSVQQLVKLKKMCQSTIDLAKLEEEASKYDAIYFNEHTYNCAMISCNATLSLLKAIATGVVQNGMAVVRPPGHHAQYDLYNGYCFINNVAVGARYLQTKEKVKKILIVDFDVHHGQGTQEVFYNDDSVLYFSIHRYEHGAFWPNLRESSFDFIGGCRGVGHNINVPLNTTGLGDADYMAIVTNILLPVAYEGEMQVTPMFYGHLIKLLSGLAEGKLAVILEGGYFLPSLAEGVAMTLSALLDDVPGELPPLGPPHESVKSTINDLKYCLHRRWGCFSILNIHHLASGKTCTVDGLELHNVIVRYVGKEPVPPFPTRNCYPVPSIQTSRSSFKAVLGMRKNKLEKNVVCYGYDDDMLLHSKSKGSEPVENPNRLLVVYQRFLELSLDTRCISVHGSRSFGEEDLRLLKLVHDPSYIDKIMNEEFTLKLKSSDMYWDKDNSRTSIQKAINILLSVVDFVMTGKSTSGIALIRPPGHHAEVNRCLGFCYINNVAVAATYMLNKYKLNRVMILDFDIHHGNGTQKMFYDSKNVLYMSIHKYERGLYFPSTTDGAHTCVGKGAGKGFNINVPFNMERMTEIDYLYTFFRIVLPVAYSYAPQCILVSAGFDAGINDLLGNYKVVPEGFGHMIQLLKPLCGGRLILAMEGGYNLNTLKHSVAFCTKTLLGDPLPKLTNTICPRNHTQKAIEQVIDVHKQYWPVLDIDKPLPNKMSALIINDKETDLNPEPDEIELITCDIQRLLQSATIFHD